MARTLGFIFSAILLLLLAPGCSTKTNQIPVNPASIQPGGIVQKGAQQFHLLGSPVKEGMQLPDTILVDAFSMEDFSFAQAKGRVAIISTVPSIDTKVCEAQTHYLGEEGDRLSDSIERITISRDTPFAQKRFAEEAKLTDIQFLSDYREGAFGMSTGLLVDKIKLLARGVMVVDREGTIRYIQVVPQLGELPDMEKAFEVAARLDKSQ